MACVKPWVRSLVLKNNKNKKTNKKKNKNNLCTYHGILNKYTHTISTHGIFPWLFYCPFTFHLNSSQCHCWLGVGSAHGCLCIQLTLGSTRWSSVENCFGLTRLLVDWGRSLVCFTSSLPAERMPSAAPKWPGQDAGLALLGKAWLSPTVATCGTPVS